jgi:hypothetical protein
MAMLQGAGIALDNSLTTPCGDDHYEELCRALHVLWGSIV